MFTKTPFHTSSKSFFTVGQMLQEAKKNTKYHAFLLIVSEIAEWSFNCYILFNKKNSATFNYFFLYVLLMLC